MSELAAKILERYNYLDDGLILLFEYFYPPHAKVIVKITFHARNPLADGDVWEIISIEAGDADLIYSNVKGNNFNSILSGVRLLRFGNDWCLDVDGNYSGGEGPNSIDEIRRYGECYIIAGQFNIEIKEN